MWNMSGSAQANYLGKVFNLPDEHHTLHVNFRQYRKTFIPLNSTAILMSPLSRITQDLVFLINHDLFIIKKDHIFQDYGIFFEVIKCKIRRLIKVNMPSVAEDSVHMSKCNKTVWIAQSCSILDPNALRLQWNIHLGQFSCCLDMISVFVSWQKQIKLILPYVGWYYYVIICMFRMFIVKWQFRFNIIPWPNSAFLLFVHTDLFLADRERLYCANCSLWHVSCRSGGAAAHPSATPEFITPSGEAWRTAYGPALWEGLWEGCCRNRHGGHRLRYFKSSKMKMRKLFQCTSGNYVCTSFCSSLVARNQAFDVVLVDTAGRMQDNAPLMTALAKLIAVNMPDLVLFVGEALVGNEAVDQLVRPRMHNVGL